MGGVVDSPRAEYDGSGRPAERMNRAQMIRRGIILLLVLVVLALNAVAFRSQDTGALLNNQASHIEGTIVDAGGAPVAGATVFVQGTSQELEATSDEAGRFMLERVPAGTQSLVVAYNGVARVYDLEIVPGRANDAGTVTYDAPADPLDVQSIHP